MYATTVEDSYMNIIATTKQELIDKFKVIVDDLPYERNFIYGSVTSKSEMIEVPYQKKPSTPAPFSQSLARTLRVRMIYKLARFRLSIRKWVFRHI